MSVRLTIHNVGHGQCISLVHENGNVMLWDCGHSDLAKPSEFLPRAGIRTINRFFVTNYDEDHISDLPSLRARLNIEVLHSNSSINSQQLRYLKLQSGPLTNAMVSMIEMLDGYNGGPPLIPPAFPDVDFRCYFNKYGLIFYDTNNLSLVTFLVCRGVTFLIPGDLEHPGWISLLQNQNFVSDLRSVNILIASHHGRENGYCREVFDYCSPSVIVFSDSPIKHATQGMANTYARHASGVQFNGVLRSVLSTRNDGTFWWDL